MSTWTGPMATGERLSERHRRTVRGSRDGDAVARILDSLVEADRDPGENLMPVLLEAARADATGGEIVNALQTVFGSYSEAPVF